MTVAKKKTTKKRLKRGRDFDAWAFKLDPGQWFVSASCRFWWEARFSKPLRPLLPEATGQWVRIKFEEVAVTEKQVKRKAYKYGRHWDAWAFKIDPDQRFVASTYFQEPVHPRLPETKGEWVLVKFVEVKT